ncbi:MAG: primosomal protein N' [Dokdonella sp.]|uniref:primosomal protein N' n=1 Tax=Dokdonella sp. TaxID=2291710 RepID=UPI003F7DFCC1
MTSILRVALPVPLHTLFDYREGATVAPVGSRVCVPFGRRERVGIVAERVDASTLDDARLKVAGDVLDEEPLLGGELLATLRWAARYYQHPLGEVLFAALPTSLRSARALPAAGIAAAELTPAGRDALAGGVARRGTRVAALLEALAAGALATVRLDALAGAAARRNALARGWIVACRLMAPARAAPGVAGPPLNEAQRAAAQGVIRAAGGFAPFLLDGVTGSGKTEVYLEIIRDCLARGRQALVLVPEIALTPQALRRFRERLGVEVAALHSGLGEVERARAWLAAARGEAPLVLGTRSAVLVPLARPGVIVVDEEHDASYKQQEGFRYHARDLALVRGKALGIPVVLGSATPSLESLANADAQRYRQLRLDERAGNARPPALRVIDLRRQRLQHGLAQPALEAIGACLARGEQVLVFRNRRGYAPVLLCHDCGWSARCPDCERALTLHKREHRLRCHHCGHEERVPNACPSCAGLALHALGEGTERLEDALGAQFPDVPVVRVDRDTTRGRRLRDALLDSLPEAGARILVGTQMLAKGHDLPHLTLVVVVGVDEGLYSVDFRSGERLGQLVVQVAGRAGRADRPGTVILQTHDPAHPLLEVLLNGGYRALAARLLDERRDAGLPPYVQFALLRAEAPQQDLLDRFLRAAAAAAPRAAGVTLHGPLAAPMPRRAGAWRAQVLAEAGERTALQAFLPPWLDAVRALPDERRVRWSIDVDPVDLY